MIVMIYILISLLIMLLIILYKYSTRDGSYSTVILDKCCIKNVIDREEYLTFMMIYKNKTEVNATNINALVSSIDKHIIKVTTRTTGNYDIRVTYRATISNFSERASCYASWLKTIIIKDNDKLRMKR